METHLSQDEVTQKKNILFWETKCMMKSEK